MSDVMLRPGTPDDAAAVADIWFDGWHPAHDGHVPNGLSGRRTRAASVLRTVQSRGVCAPRPESDKPGVRRTPLKESL